MTLKDKFNKTIKVGQTIVYPVRRGSSMELRHAVVSGRDGNVVLATTDLGVKVRIQVLSRCAIVEV